MATSRDTNGGGNCLPTVSCKFSLFKLSFSHTSGIYFFAAAEKKEPNCDTCYVVSGRLTTIAVNYLPTLLLTIAFVSAFAD
jgi:hypothetical protein